MVSANMVFASPVYIGGSASADASGNVDLQPAGGKAEYSDVQSGARALGVVPAGYDANEPSSARVLPTVNKRTAAEITAAVSVHGWESEKASVVQDFEENTEKLAENDDNITSIEATPDGIRIAYKRNAKLFGFIPVAYYHAFTVDGKGNMAQGRPWWLIFATSDAASFGDNVMMDFKKQQDALRWFKAPTALELAAERLSALANILKTRHDK